MRSALLRLHVALDQRADAIRTQRPDWLCAKGCDTCCRQLAAIPELSRGEWECLRAGLAALPEAQLAEFDQRMRELVVQRERPFTCPFLERQSGACPVYVHRPVVCRSYGFHVQRELGLYCDDIRLQVERGELSEVVWGNHDAVDQALAGLGERDTLTRWYAAWRGASGPG
jgi:Fe-S-cluster containining protein